jgi:hypothetical protein
VDAFVAEVWNPFTGNYQLADTVQHAMQRVQELTSLIYQMRLQRHPKRDMLTDAPDVDRTVEPQWAEFRINAATHRSYDTGFDRSYWRREIDLTHAVNITCAEAGCVMPI